MTPATSFVSKPSSFPTPWSSWTMKSPVRRSAKEASARPSRLSARGGRLRKTCVSGSRTRPSSRQTKPRRAGATANRSSGSSGRSSPGVEDARVGALEQVVGAERLARVREGDDDAVAAVDEAVQLVLGLGEAARGDRRPLRLERERLRLRERVELGRAGLSEIASSPSSAQTRRTSSGCQTKSGARSSTGTRSSGISAATARPSSSASVGSCEVGEPLGRRVDDGAVDRVERALGEGRERAHLLDLVAVELDAERLAAGGREDVDEAAADGELAALLGALDPLVAGEREVLGEAVEAGLAADLEPDRLRPLRRRRHALGERGRGGGDEAAAREHVERARPLADEVRRRLEAGAPADAAARQERDALGADEPAGRLGEVARVGVLGQEHDEPALELLVQRREQERQHRLGDAGPGRQGSRERLQALEREQLPDERWSTGRSMTSGRNAGSGSLIVRRPVYDALHPMGDRDQARESVDADDEAQRDALAAELAELEGPRRAEVVEAIADRARVRRPLGELRLPDPAKNEQGLLERRITILRDRVENAVIVEQAADGVVGVGSVVEVEDESGGRFEVEISSVARRRLDRLAARGRARSAPRSATPSPSRAPKGAWTAHVISVRTA